MKRNVAALADGTFDVLVIGGGIAGAGVALDAAARGLRVALIDKGDFASGTSSLSSKLIHGGLRYLEWGDLRLVYEALHERARLLRNAPHLVWPLRFLLPFYEGSRVRPWKWRSGLALYDLLAGRANIHRSRGISLEKVKKEVPGLRRQSLVGAAEYFDAQMDDARLCLEVIKTAVDYKAIVANYVEALSFMFESQRISGIRAQDHVGKTELSIRARQVVNATGPWADSLCRLAGDSGGPLLRPTKGVHVVFPGRNLAGGFLLLHPRDGRVFFVLPWLGKTVVGTTDTDCDESPDSLSITDDDIHYLLEGHNHFFDPPVTRDNILGHFVGVRPLFCAGEDDPAAASREYRLLWSETGLLTIAGGKYTTYRHMAEKAVDALVKQLGVRKRCRTHNLALASTPFEPWPSFASMATKQLRRDGLSDATAWHLVRRYGRHAFTVAGYLGKAPAMGEPILSGEPDIRAEIAYQRDAEMAIYPEDHFLRRTRLGLFGLARNSWSDLL